MTQCFSVAHRSVTHPGPPRYKGHNQWSFGKTDGKPLADRRAGRRQEGGAGRLGGVEEGGVGGLGKWEPPVLRQPGQCSPLPRNYLVRESSQGLGRAGPIERVLILYTLQCVQFSRRPEPKFIYYSQKQNILEL